MDETRLAILDRLDAGTASGPELAASCGVTRAAIWKHVQSLRDAGFEISVDDEGYRLVETPEYGAAAVILGLDAPYEVRYVERTESTNEVARSLAETGADEVVVLADTQTAGRGRLGRAWSSASGGIYLSVLVRPTLPPGEVSVLTLLAAVAVAQAIEERGGAPTIKWPNDVRLEGKKVSGILTEMEGEADRVSWVIVGIGINANVDSEDLPPGGTSLRSELETDVDRASLVRDVLERFYALQADPRGGLEDWRSRSDTIGRTVRISTHDSDICGEAIDVTYPGHLRVETDSGMVDVHTGDCEYLR